MKIDRAQQLCIQPNAPCLFHTALLSRFCFKRFTDLELMKLGDMVLFDNILLHNVYLYDVKCTIFTEMMSPVCVYIPHCSNRKVRSGYHLQANSYHLISAAEWEKVTNAIRIKIQISNPCHLTPDVAYAAINANLRKRFR